MNLIVAFEFIPGICEGRHW